MIDIIIKGPMLTGKMVLAAVVVQAVREAGYSIQVVGHEAGEVEDLTQLPQLLELAAAHLEATPRGRGGIRLRMEQLSREAPPPREGEVSGITAEQLRRVGK